MNDSTSKRISKTISEENYIELKKILKSRYRGNFDNFISSVLTAIDLGLVDLIEMEGFSNDIDLSGVSAANFIREAVEEKRSKIRKAKDSRDLLKAEAEKSNLIDLKNRTGKGSAILKLNAAIKEIEKYNYQVLPEKRVLITRTFLQKITGVNRKTLADFFNTEKVEIERINNKFELITTNRLNCKAFQSYLESKQNIKVTA